jgi:hypothetical protein
MNGFSACDCSRSRSSCRCSATQLFAAGSSGGFTRHRLSANPSCFSAPSLRSSASSASSGCSPPMTGVGIYELARCCSRRRFYSSTLMVDRRSEARQRRRILTGPRDRRSPRGIERRAGRMSHGKLPLYAISAFSREITADRSVSGQLSCAAHARPMDNCRLLRCRQTPGRCAGITPPWTSTPVIWSRRGPGGGGFFVPGFCGYR